MTYPRPEPVNLLHSADSAIPTIKLAFNPRSGKHGAAAKAKRFIRGPIPFQWMQKANALPGKAGAVGVALFFLKGVKQSSTFAISAEVEVLAGCSRQTFSRNLAALKGAGLIVVQTRPGARAIVTLLDT